MEEFKLGPDGEYIPTPCEVEIWVNELIIDECHIVKAFEAASADWVKVGNAYMHRDGDSYGSLLVEVVTKSDVYGAGIVIQAGPTDAQAKNIREICFLFAIHFVFWNVSITWKY